MTRKTWSLSLTAAMLLGLAAPLLASTGDPLPGIDVLVRKEPICPCTLIIKGAIDLPPLPPDFFGPGSDPFTGEIFMEWIDDDSDDDDWIDLDYVEGATPNVYETQLEPLTLTSVEPIDVGGGAFYDVTYTISADGLPPGEPVAGSVILLPGQTLSPGSSHLVVDSFFDIAYRIEFSEAGTGNPAGTPITGTTQLQLQDIDLPIYRRADGRVVLGSDGSSIVPVQFASPGGGHVLVIQSVPEPATGLLALIAALGCVPLCCRTASCRA